MRGYSDALVIPLRPDLHYQGRSSMRIDGGHGVEAWEKKYGSQADLVDQVSQSLGYNLWELHRQWLGNPKCRLPSGNT